MQLTDPYPDQEQIRRYSIDTLPYYPTQSPPFPNYYPAVSNDYFLEESCTGRARIMSFSDGKKKKGDVVDFYTKYKTEVSILIV